MLELSLQLRHQIYMGLLWMVREAAGPIFIHEKGYFRTP
jgi:hypothetical protein